MAKKVAAWVLPVLLMAGLAFAIWRWQASKAAPDVTFRTAPVEKKRITARVTASGTLQATVTVQVGAQVSGRIAKLNADFNSTVKKGEIIAKIDPQLFVAAVQREQANYVAAKAVLAKAEAQQRNAELVLKRTRALTEQGLSAVQDLQNAETAAAVAASETDVAKATLDQVAAALNQAKVNLSYTDIVAPIDGVVIARAVDVGQTVASSLQAPVLFLLAEDLKKMQVHTSIAEGDVGRLVAGMDAWFTVDAYPGQRFKGHISQIRNAPTTVQNVVTYDAVIDVDNGDLRLRPGMTATTTIVHAERDGVLAIPNAALRFKAPSEVTSALAPPPAPAASLSVTAAGAEPAVSASAAPAGSARRRSKAGNDKGERSDSERTVYVLRGGRAEPITVRLGLTDGTSTEVVSGDLKEGDQVVVDASVGGKPAGSGAPAGGMSRGMGRMF